RHSVQQGRPPIAAWSDLASIGASRKGFAVSQRREKGKSIAKHALAEKAPRRAFPEGCRSSRVCRMPRAGGWFFAGVPWSEHGRGQPYASAAGTAAQRRVSTPTAAAAISTAAVPISSRARRPGPRASPSLVAPIPSPPVRARWSGSVVWEGRAT
ncbi:unnamed protein product, partial [Ectocarpus sp. 12 AP-2014]